MSLSWIVVALVIGIPSAIVFLGILDAALMYRDLQRGHGPCWPKDDT